MFKIRFYIVLCVCLIIFCFGLTGCVKNEYSAHFQYSNGLDSNDYNSYLKKIWVAASWDGGEYYYPSSFCITKIENGLIEGKLTTGAIAEPDFYVYSFDPPKNSGALTGTIYDGLAECHFSDERGNKGTVTLVFRGNSEIEATIKYTSKEYTYDYESSDESYLFRPYNFTDIEQYLDSRGMSTLSRTVF